MPIYEFQCADCLSITEEFFHMPDRVEEIDCKCGKKAEKIISSFFAHGSCLEGGHNGRHYHAQSGTWYSSNKELEMKNKAKGMEEIPNAIRRDCNSQKVDDWQSKQKKLRESGGSGGAVDKEARNRMANTHKI